MRGYLQMDSLTYASLDRLDALIAQQPRPSVPTDIEQLVQTEDALQHQRRSAANGGGYVTQMRRTRMAPSC